MNKPFYINKFSAVFLIGIISIATISFGHKLWEPENTHSKVKTEIVTFTQLQQQAEHKKNDTLYVINFWATWCKPCVQEMPFFEEASKKFTAKKVKIIYVSLNSVKEAATVEHFTASKNIQNRVLLLNAPNPNDWIDKIDASWSGAIPATVIYKAGEKVFFKEGGFTQEELNATITDKTK